MRTGFRKVGPQRFVPSLFTPQKRIPGSAGVSPARFLLAGLALAFALAPAAPAATRQASRFGAMSGLVADAQGAPQMGAAVALLAADGRVLQQVYSNDRGAFLMERVLPGLYSLRISLASYLPVLKENIIVEAGGKAILSIQLSSLFDAVDVLRGRRPAATRDDDWTWVVRSAGANRPLLRYRDGEAPPAQTAEARAPRGPADTQAVLQFSGGGGRSSNMGSEADFNTSFAMANNLFANTSVLLSGNLGYERNTPATAFRGAVRQQFGSSAPELSVTLRQVFLPTTFWGRGSTREDNLQILTLSAADRLDIAGTVNIEYGLLYDSIAFLDRLNTLSPYGRITYQTSPSSSVKVYYTEGAPRVRQPGSDALRDAASQLGVFPRLSMRHGAATTQRGRHVEVAGQQALGSRTKIEAGVYRDDIQNLTLNSVADGNLPVTDFLPDVFSQQYAFNSGNHHTSGVRAALQHKFSDHVQATFAYSYGGVVVPERAELYTSSPEELRSILKMHRRHALAARLAADVPVTRTRVFAGYKWVLGTPVTAGDIYDESLGQADPYLNVVVRQPLPGFVSLAGRVEALADFRNLLAQGYVPIQTAAGKRLLLVQNVRSFRGGFSFVF